MLTTFLIWILAGSAAWGYSRIFFGNPSRQNDSVRQTPESVAAQMYFGIMLVSFALLASALVTNISSWLGFALAVPGIAVAATQFRSTAPPSAHGSTTFPRYIYFGIGLLILAYFVSTVEVQFYDTGLYHQQMAKWLSDFGLVPGITLLERRYGWTSSWFAVAAALNHAPLRGREAAIIGGIPFALMILTGAAIAWRYRLSGILPGVRALTWSLFSGVLVVVSFVWSVESSLSPDIVIWLLPIMAALVLSEPSTNKSGRVGLALLLASLVFTVKLSALPIVAYCGVLWLWQFVRDPSGRKALSAYLVLATIVVLVLGVANIRTSGCPLYPSPVGCVSGDSAVGGAFAAGVGQEVREYAVQGNRHMGLFVTIALVSTVFAFIALRNDPFVLHALAASWSGIVFILMTAPNPRFGLGYLLLPVATSLAIFVPWVDRRWSALLLTGRNSLPWLTAAAALLFLISSIHAPESRSSLLLPNRMPSANGDPIHVVNQQLNKRTALSLAPSKLGGVLVLRPLSSDQCWDAALPCTVDGWRSIELREPAQGLRGGFRWSTSPLEPGSSAASH